ncbi:hypothetical protein M9458_043063, partial [Cirrhinus mrigala]
TQSTNQIPAEFSTLMDPFSCPEYGRSLEDHTRLFLEVANYISYPDDALCLFYDASVSTTCRAL